MSKEDAFSLSTDRGTYTLVLSVEESFRRKVGALGLRQFQSGLYTYTGSALGKTQNLRIRIARHLRTVKRHRWHIDYLLDNATIFGIVYCVSDRRLECLVSQSLGGKRDVEAIIPGFGSSDCSLGCKSHLYIHAESNRNELTEFVKRVYEECGCVPSNLDLD